MATDRYSQLFWFAGGFALLAGLLSAFSPPVSHSKLGSLNAISEWFIALSLLGCVIGLMLGRRISKQSAHGVLVISSTLLAIGTITLGAIGWSLL
ncbi:hypothetical protein FQY83_13860 [Luteimonas marina]|uniref:Uncharacterized protein n=1 Tax=Luteimonas marina TaxID=488485 RepID=A0A5C5U0K9_9GAMM|nr:hypothetical protein [Luteimonas marina]TWT19426.1 hypothetical protein FQY83_13860 [Luteimonas marina]